MNLNNFKTVLSFLAEVN